MATTKNVQSLERAFAILELLQNASEGEMSLKDIANALDLNKSTTFGLINTMVNLGYIQQNDNNQQYMLGLRLLSFSESVKQQSILRHVVHPYMEKLNAKYDETVHCAIQFGEKILYIDKVEATNSPIYINTRVGATRNMHCTGVGKCILANMPEEQQMTILSKPLQTATFNTITNSKQLKIELEKIRTNGYAFDDEESVVGLFCVAVPVFSAQGTVACAISISGIKPRLKIALDQGIVQELKGVANTISKIAFGYETD